MPGRALSERVAHLRNLGLSAIGTVVFFRQLRHPFVRFAWPFANEVTAFVLALGLPWLTNVMIYRLGARLTRIVSIVAAVPLLLWSGCIFLVFMIAGFQFGPEKIFETNWKGSVIRLYRVNGGATTDFGVVIRQERTVFPGILLVHDLDEFYPCRSLDITGTQNGARVQDNHSDCISFGQRRRDYPLKRFIYF